MLVVRTFEVALDRAESVGDAMRRARAALAAAGADSAPVRLYLSDTRTGTRKSCARVVKAFAELGSLACTVEGGDVVSSFAEGVPGSTHHSSTAMTMSRALQLADGVPRSFPLNDSNFFFGPVPALLAAADQPRSRFTGRPHVEIAAGEIALVSHWWITGRRTRLFAAASEDLPPIAAADLPPVSGEVGGLLGAMGGIRRERRRLEASSPGEDAAIQGQNALAEERLAELRPRWAAERARLALPHGLDPEDAAGGGFLPLGAALAEVLGPHGYRERHAPRPQPGGMWVLDKRTARSNELELRLDRGPINGRLSARLILCGPLWRHDLGPLPLAPDRFEPRVGSQATARRALANLAAAAAAAEAILVPPLEAIHGEGFAWLTAVTGS